MLGNQTTRSQLYMIPYARYIYRIIYIMSLHDGLMFLHYECSIIKVNIYVTGPAKIGHVGS